MWLQSKFDKPGVNGIVVVLLCLNARIREVLNLHLQPEAFTLISDHFRQFNEWELLGELVENAVLTLCWRRYNRQFDAPDRIPQIDVPTYLLAFAVNAERIASSSLD